MGKFAEIEVYAGIGITRRQCRLDEVFLVTGDACIIPDTFDFGLRPGMKSWENHLFGCTPFWVKVNLPGSFQVTFTQTIHETSRLPAFQNLKFSVFPDLYLFFTIGKLRRIGVAAADVSELIFRCPCSENHKLTLIGSQCKRQRDFLTPLFKQRHGGYLTCNRIPDFRHLSLLTKMEFPGNGITGSIDHEVKIQISRFVVNIIQQKISSSIITKIRYDFQGIQSLSGGRFLHDHGSFPLEFGQLFLYVGMPFLLLCQG